MTNTTILFAIVISFLSAIVISFLSTPVTTAPISGSSRRDLLSGETVVSFAGVPTGDPNTGESSMMNGDAPPPPTDPRGRAAPPAPSSPTDPRGRATPPAPPSPAVPAPDPRVGGAPPPAVPAPPPPEATSPSPSPATPCNLCCKRRTLIKEHGPSAWAKGIGRTATVVLGLMVVYSLVVLCLVVTKKFNGYIEGLNEMLDKVKGGAVEHTLGCFKLGIVALFALLLVVKLVWLIFQSFGWTRNASPDLDEIQKILEAAEEVLAE